MSPSSAVSPLRNLTLCLLLSAGFCGLSGPGSLARQAPGEPVTEEADRRRPPFSIGRLLELLRDGTPQPVLMGMASAGRSDIELTIDDVLRLRKLGARPELILVLAQGGDSAAPPPQETAPQQSFTPPGGSLTSARIARMHRKGASHDEIAALIAARGLKEVPDLDDLLELHAQGAPGDLLRLLADAPPPSSTPVAVPAPATAAAPPAREPPPGTPQDDAAGQEAEPERDRSGRELRDQPLAPARPGQDRVLIASVPSGAGVYLSSARTPRRDAVDRDYFVGRTPLSLEIPPGLYQVVVEKPAGEFEADLLPAWRTLHDTTTSRSLLDNAHLTFDPADCCLPKSLEETVEVRAIPMDRSEGVIGDLFDGLAPYLFDGELLQILDVRRSRIHSVQKLYALRKTGGQPRTLVAAFVAAEGDPLDLASMPDLPQGEPFAAWLDVAELDYLRSPAALPALAELLGVEPPDLSSAVAMLRRAGKAILHQQVEGGIRLLALSVDDMGRLRLTEQKVTPLDLFAPPPPAPKKKKRPAEPPPPPPLPSLDRSVVPGLGLPRLRISNGREHALALLLDDGRLLFAPPGGEAEFTVDPGTYAARLLAPGGGPASTGTLHLSYHSRYAMEL